jgi:hypothetical protein
MGAQRALPVRYQKSYCQALTGDGLLDLSFGLIGFDLIKNTETQMFLKAKSFEKKISQDDLPAETYF